MANTIGFFSSTVIADMDHRGLLKAGSGFVIAGGMRSKQTVSKEVLYFELP